MTRPGVLALALGALALSDACKSASPGQETGAPRLVPASTAATTATGAADARPAPLARFIVGGDARNDRSDVVPWAFRVAKEKGARAFLFLGDMELDPKLDKRFQVELRRLDPSIVFYPVVGNHEVKRVGRYSVDRKEFQDRFKRLFLDNKRNPIVSEVPDRIVYSKDLEGGVHFVALDNVSGAGFGEPQLAWLEQDLIAARKNPATHYILVGMHKALAGNPITGHAMGEDHDAGVGDSEAALALFRVNRVDVIFASHEHLFAEFQQGVSVRTSPAGSERRSRRTFQTPRACITFSSSTCARRRSTSACRSSRRGRQPLQRATKMRGRSRPTQSRSRAGKPDRKCLLVDATSPK